jgi:hypothetical protein
MSVLLIQKKMMTQICFRFNKTIVEVIKTFKFNEEYRYNGSTKQWTIKNEFLDNLLQKLRDVNVNCIVDYYNEQLHGMEQQKQDIDQDIIKLKSYMGGVLLIEKMKYETYKLFTKEFIKFIPITLSINNNNNQMHHVTDQYVDKFYMVCKNNNIQYKVDA